MALQELGTKRLLDGSGLVFRPVRIRRDRFMGSRLLAPRSASPEEPERLREVLDIFVTSMSN